MSSKVFKWNAISLPTSVIAGQSFVISVDVSALEALFDCNSRAVLDNSANVILPSNGEYKSRYSGEDIDRFISEVLT